MQTNLPKTTHRLTSRWGAGATALLLSASLILAACGGDSGGAGDAGDTGGAEVEATVVTTETEVEETPEADAEVEATAVVETETGLITETEVLTETNVVTDVDVTEVITETVVTTGTVEGGEESEVITDTEVITEAGEAEETETEDVGATEEMTDTESMDDSDTMTGTGATTDTAQTDVATDQGMMGVSGGTDEYVRASTLLDYDFDNMDGEVSGDLEDLLIDLSTGRVLFASIEYGGILDLGDKDIVVPLNAFAVGAEGELVLNIDEATLENYPDVGNDWPDLNDPAWDDDVATFWGDTGIESGLNFQEATTSAAWASDLIGHNVADLGAGAGSVLDILVNLSSAQAAYAIVDYGEGLDTDPYIIPFAAFDVANWQEGLNYNPDFTPDLLEGAPRFDQDAYPEGTAVDRDFGDQFESWWNDMGFSNDLNNDGEND